MTGSDAHTAVANLMRRHVIPVARAVLLKRACLRERGSGKY